MFWGSGIDLPEDGLEDDAGGVHHRRAGARPGEKALLSLQLPAEFVIVFEPVTHAAHFIDVKGEPTKERQTLSLVFNKVHRADRSPSRCGRARCGSRWRTRATCARCRRLWIAGAHAARPARQAAAVPHRQAAAHQPDVPRHLSHRHARRRSGAEDHQPDVPVHRPEGLDRAVRAGRRSRRLRSGARALPRAERDRRGGGGRGGQDHRRRGDGDVPDARPRARGGACGCASRCKRHPRTRIC